MSTQTMEQEARQEVECGCGASVKFGEAICSQCESKAEEEAYHRYQEDIDEAEREHYASLSDGPEEA